MKPAYLFFSLVGLGGLLAACSSSPSASSTSSGTGGTSATGTGGAGGHGTTTGTGGAGTGGSAAAGDWSCVGKVTWPASETPKASVNLTFIKLIGDGGLADLTVKVCDKADPSCAAPLSMGVTDAMGKIALSVDTGATGFDGFLDVSGGNIVPALIYYLPPIGADVPAGTLEVPLVLNDNLGLITALAGGIKLDPARGQLLAIAYDCAAANAEAVKIATSTADANSSQAYLEGMALNPKATQTDASGGAVVFNLPAGATTLSVTLAGPGTLAAKTSVGIRAGAFTYATLPPTPLP